MAYITNPSPIVHHKYAYDFYSNRDNIYFRYCDPTVNTVDTTRVLTASVSATHIGSLFPTSFPDYNSSDLYPMAVRYADPENHTYVIERPPFEVSVDFSSSKSYRKRKHPKILANKTMWIPWTVSLIKFYKNRFNNNSNSAHTNLNSYSYEFSLFFNNKPLSSVNDLLIPAWLPNVSSTGTVCMGADASPVSSLIGNFDKSSLTEVYNLLFNSFFSGWNADLTPTFLDTSSLIQFRENLQKSNPKIKYPQYFVNPTNYWSYTSSNYLTNLLLTVSSMDYSQMSNYIEELISTSDLNITRRLYRLSSLISRSSYPSNSPLDLYQDYISSDISFSEKDYSHYFSNLFQYITSYSFSISIENVPTSFDSVKLVDNPYLISCVYNKIKNTISESPNPYSNLSQSLSIDFDYNQISHYLNTVEENANA